MLGVFADNHYSAFPFDNLALFTNLYHLPQRIAAFKKIILFKMKFLVEIFEPVRYNNLDVCECRACARYSDSRKIYTSAATY